MLRCARWQLNAEVRARERRQPRRASPDLPGARRRSPACAWAQLRCVYFRLKIRESTCALATRAAKPRVRLGCARRCARTSRPEGAAAAHASCASLRVSSRHRPRRAGLVLPSPRPQMGASASLTVECAGREQAGDAIADADADAGSPPRTAAQARAAAAGGAAAAASRFAGGGGFCDRWRRIWRRRRERKRQRGSGRCMNGVPEAHWSIQHVCSPVTFACG